MNRLEKLEKMVKDACEKNDYELYREACWLLHLYIKCCSESEEGRACSVLYDALCNKKSEEFLCVARNIVKGDKGLTYADTMCYALLLSVRARHAPVTAFLLDMCDEIQVKVLKTMAEEGKK